MALQKTNRGFTIVELLIVIVVIAILAAISIVAYNGIQNRARNTTNAESASQLKTKIESWNSIIGSYPSTTALSGNLTDADATEAKIDGALAGKFTASTTVTTAAGTPTQPAVDAAQPVIAYPCGTAANPTGYVVVWGTNPADATAKTVLGC